MNQKINSQKVSKEEVKKQHMVPRFYLKNFSDDKKRIGVIAKNHDAKYMSIKSFYRESVYDQELEKDLASHENVASHIIGNIIDNPGTIRLSLENWMALIEFTVMAYSRTGRVYDENKTLLKMLGQIIPESLGITDWRIKFPFEETPNLITMIDIPENISRVLALERTIIINDSDNNFLTSDCPVCVYNPVVLKSPDCTRYDMFSSGAVIILPISPKVAILFHDPEYYILGKNGAVLHIGLGHYIDDINRLLIANSYEYVFFKEESQRAELESILVWEGEEYYSSYDANLQDGDEFVLKKKFQVEVDVDLDFIRPIKTKVNPGSKYGNMSHILSQLALLKTKYPL